MEGQPFFEMKIELFQNTSFKKFSYRNYIQTKKVMQHLFCLVHKLYVAWDQYMTNFGYLHFSFFFKFKYYIKISESSVDQGDGCIGN